jgi:ABC-2 type transport system permease protein
MRVALAILGNDLRRRLRDRSALLVALVLPLALAGIFSLALADVSDEDVSFEYALEDDDGGRTARAFAGALAQVEVVALTDDRGAASATFVLPRGFSAAVEAGRPARIDVVGDVNAPIGTLVARSIAERFGADVRAVGAAVAAAAGADGPAALAERASRVPTPVTLEDVTATRKELDPKTFYAAGMAVFFLFFTVQLGISSLLEERRNGTLGRLLAAPIRRSTILGGKVLTSLVIGIASMSVLAVATSLLLGADWGNPLGVAILIVAGVLAATALTALVATLARTQEQAGNWQTIAALVLGMLGGSFFPVSQAGGLLATLSLATPHAWFLRGLADVSAGGGAADALPAAGAILVFAAVAGLAALARLGSLVRP